MKLIGVAGRAQSGKDTFARLAQRVVPDIKPLAFAAGLKEEVAEFLTKCEVDFEQRHLWGTNEDKEATLRISHYYCNVSPIHHYLGQYADYSNGWWYFQPRTLLQWWGTDYRRREVPDYWVKKCLLQCTGDGVYVITDVRFPNEAAAIKEAGGILVRVKRKNGTAISNAAHISETALDNYKDWDYTLLNNSTLEKYAEIVEDLLRGELDEE